MEKSKQKDIARPIFIGQGELLKLDGFTIRSPLVYLCSLEEMERFPFAIVKELPFSFLKSEPYTRWYSELSYTNLTPEQRGSFLKWLAAGKSNDKAEYYYHTLYLQNLEYRAVMERSDHKTVLKELLKLHRGLSLFLSRRRQCELLISYLLFNIDEFTYGEQEELINFFHSLECGSSIFESGSYIKVAEDRLSPVIFYLYMLDLMGPDSNKVVNKIGPLFRQHFEMELEPYLERLRKEAMIGCQIVKYRYYTDSGRYLSGCTEKGLYPGIPEELIQSLITLWERSIRDFTSILNKGNRLCRGDQFALLPSTLRPIKKAELKKEFELFASQKRSGFYKAYELADYFGYPYSSHLPSATSRKLGDLLEACDYGVEPDSRSWGGCYQTVQQVVIFPSEAPQAPDYFAYRRALYLIKAALFIIESSDTSPTLPELQLLREQIRLLSPVEKLSEQRLEKLLELTAAGGVEAQKANVTLRETLDGRQATECGLFLFRLASINGKINKGQAEALKSSCRGLRLTKKFYNPIFEELELKDKLEGFSLLKKGTKSKQKGSIIPSPPVERLNLNPKALDRVLDETERVKGVLHNIFAEEDRQEPAENEKKNSEKSHQLSPELESFMQHILTKANWEREELHKMALERKIMLDSAVEEINFWCEEQTGDYLIYEEQNSYAVQRELLESV